MEAALNEDYLVCSQNYAEFMNGTVIPWLSRKSVVSTIPGYENRPLYCVRYDAENPLATVLIIHGFTENIFKYSELIWSLLHLRFSVVAYDQRGHGRSWRDKGLPDISVTHVDRFSDYIHDMQIVCDSLLKGMPGPYLLFAHSMGGAVAALFLEQNPGLFSATVLSSPMIAPNTGGFPLWTASALAALADLLGIQKKNPFFMKRYSGPEDFTTSCATDPGRFAWYDEIKAARPEFRNSVPSYRWSDESIHVTNSILADGAPERITCPVLLFSAGIDTTVLPGPQKKLAARIPDCRFVLVEQAKHEIYRSANDVLFPWWHEVIHFFTEVISSCRS